MHKRLLIDGYNLAHKLNLKITKETLERARGEVQRKVSLYIGRKKIKATIVYDGRWILGAAQTLGNLEIVFTADGETADSRIKKMIDDASGQKSLCVISSDNAILRYAEISRVATMRSEDFLAELSSMETKRGGKPKPRAESKPDCDAAEIEEWKKAFAAPPSASEGDQP